MSNLENFPMGIIEGYFGKYWSMKDRLTYPKWLKAHGFTFFLYAPKNDTSLRKEWDKPYSNEYLLELKKFQEECKAHDIAFGLGISPLGATLDTAFTINKLKEQINILSDELEPNMLAILFDDTKKVDEDDGKKQNEILLTLNDLLKEKNITPFTCPSYYSDDPILDKIFGQRSTHYYQDFAQDLPLSFNIFWTGQKVISQTFEKDSLINISSIFNRKVFIWDNYPVNDGKKASSHLFLEPFLDRSEVLTFCSGIAINPMKEPNLSKIPLASLEDALLGKPHKELTNTLLMKAFYNEDSSCFENLSVSNFMKIFTFLEIFAPTFAKTPVEELTKDAKAQILSELAKLPNNCIRKEITDFLEGKYTFDPTCLTG